MGIYSTPSALGIFACSSQYSKCSLSILLLLEHLGWTRLSNCDGRSDSGITYERLVNTDGKCMYW